MIIKSDKVESAIALIDSATELENINIYLEKEDCKELINYIHNIEYNYENIKRLNNIRKDLLMSQYGYLKDNALKLIDILNGISLGYYDAPLYFRINIWGYNFVIKYLRYGFIIEDVKTGYNKCCFKKGDDFEVPLSALNNKVVIIEEGECYE